MVTGDLSNQKKLGLTFKVIFLVQIIWRNLQLPPVSVLGYIQHMHRSGNSVIFVHAIEMPAIPSRDSEYIKPLSNPCHTHLTTSPYPDYSVISHYYSIANIEAMNTLGPS